MKPKIYSQSVHKEILTFYLAGLKLTIDNNLTEVDQNVEERFEPGLGMAKAKKGKSKSKLTLPAFASLPAKRATKIEAPGKPCLCRQRF